MGHVLKSQYVEIQNQRSPFNNMDLMWKKDVQHGNVYIIKLKCAYMPHAWVAKILNSEQNYEDSLMEWNIYKLIPHKKI
jgi:hypothetical protein